MMHISSTCCVWYVSSVLLLGGSVFWSWIVNKPRQCCKSSDSHRSDHFADLLNHQGPGSARRRGDHTAWPRERETGRSRRNPLAGSGTCLHS
ncbi:uncharacterized protein BP01DRAFT_112075 [Aspergillus saccharolyticus JOP 1030-1]|uniref:Uncharacterized protein n=1 Tax=Aspergillus saccharolyticus JOP 1030-1 TaxID=1450539 RepID=A0A318ZQF4_9EURO|nr:hypothetical protein BP01DRAFT_112075 [Aspergillus saccharolyticus JOP 1030-1]PYH48774.1 hypothetical protein BP01DRAFT_112075 [Aspergillus saccharolyticus JOP 1030-1]